MLVCVSYFALPRSFDGQSYDQYKYNRGDTIPDGHYYGSINEDTRILSWTIKVKNYPFTLVYDKEDFVPIEEYRNIRIDSILSPSDIL
jgi:hypothetical protein